MAKLYYLTKSKERVAAYDAIFGDSAMTVDGKKRRVLGWDDWAIPTRIGTAAYCQLSGAAAVAGSAA